MTSEEKIVIMAGLQRDGATYQLHPLSRRRLEAAFPDVRQAPSVFVGYDTQADFQTFHRSIWAQIALLLTGVTIQRLRELGPVFIFTPQNGDVIEVGG